ncbi:WxcM-like domain-containing protein [Pedobacter sp.]
MDKNIEVIKGGNHTDERGTINFINDFDMQLVKRFYKIEHPDTSVVRGWRGHKIEQRWFHVIQGKFDISLILIDNWEKPSATLQRECFSLSSADNAVIHIPAGYASALQAREPNSELIVFADYPVSHASNDDYLYPIDYFNINFK